MIEKELFPPYLPEELFDKRDLWIGQSNPFNPQLWISEGPTSDELKKAHKEGTKIKLAIESRTADMEENEPNDKLGVVEVQIYNLIEDEDKDLHLLAIGENTPFGNGRIWVWCYHNGIGAADVPARHL